MSEPCAGNSGEGVFCTGASSHIKSFVLRSGRISRAQSRFYENPSPFIIPYTGKPENFALFFGNDHPLFVEIGFGMGTAAAEIAAANPGNNYLGIEVFKAGIGKLLWEIEKRGLSNIRIIEHDAVEVLEKMFLCKKSGENPENSPAGFHIFFPDPWPKKRHHKRRLIQAPFARLLASRLCPGGYVYMVTDWEDYAQSALAVLSAVPGLVNPHDGFAPPQAWRPRTKFEKKGLLKNHTVREIYFVKG